MDNNQITTHRVIEVLERYKLVNDIVEGDEEDWIKVQQIRDEETYMNEYLDDLIVMLKQIQ